MARPAKQGLDYFPFDVDFFSDEKIVAISWEFGIKGEITIIKLLCAVYRNGYFIEWSPIVRVKLLKELPGVSACLLDQIVKRLVEWDFFNKDLFNSDSILTSKGIQNRYQTICGKFRRQSVIDRYNLLQPQTQNQPPQTTITEKQTPYTATFAQEISSMKADRQWLKTGICQKFNIDTNEATQRLDAFLNHCLTECSDKPHTSSGDARRHFCSWMRKAYTATKQPNTTHTTQAPERQRPCKTDTQISPQQKRFQKLVPKINNQYIMSYAQFEALGFNDQSDNAVLKYCTDVTQGRTTVPSIIELLKTTTK